MHFLLIQCTLNQNWTIYGVFEETGYKYTCESNLFGLEDDQFPHPPSSSVFHVRRVFISATVIDHGILRFRIRQVDSALRRCE
jgi:hypothetical protein